MTYCHINIGKVVGIHYTPNLHGDGLVVKSSIPIRRPRVRFPVAVFKILNNDDKF